MQHAVSRISTLYLDELRGVFRRLVAQPSAVHALATGVHGAVDGAQVNVAEDVGGQGAGEAGRTLLAWLEYNV